MPATVPNVAWKCLKCGKRRWLKPGRAKVQQFCSRKCQHEGMRAEKPVREKQGQRLARYGWRTCPVGNHEFEAKTQTQKYCSHEHQIEAARDRHRVEQPEPRPCESCGIMFTPRKGSAGRFHNRECTYAGNRGEKSYAWKGGYQRVNDGYIRVKCPGHPRGQGINGYVLEHILVMEEKLGRPLQPHETVHHINGIRDDNRPENLQIRQGGHGNGWVNRCADCGSFNIIHEALPTKDTI